MISIYDTRVVEDNSYKDTTETICIRSIISYAGQRNWSVSFSL